jgi:pheromone shutdown protein TraB
VSADPQALTPHHLQSFYNVFKLLGFVPGLEFKVAMNEAKKLKIPVVYGDQESSVRRSASLTLLNSLFRLRREL